MKSIFGNISADSKYIINAMFTRKSFKININYKYYWSHLEVQRISGVTVKLFRKLPDLVGGHGLSVDKRTDM